ncbi:Insulin-like peptide receptor [Nymphon striatum]|nr:Insulin-like peptide receptor [Nymphon striatum]
MICCCLLYSLKVLYPWVVLMRAFCQSLSIRNSVEKLKILENCTVIEGYLEILLMDKSTIQSFKKFSFPKLVEIRDYLLLYRVRGLASIGTLFPNLAIIRGSTLFSNYALVVYELVELKDIGLVSLSDILRGSVRIEKNPNLCYVNTINWDHIAKSGKDGHLITANKNHGECHDVCPHEGEISICPASGTHFGLYLCWNRSKCQKVCSRECVKLDRTCAQSDRCCHLQCLGGCSGSEATSCVACRNVQYNGKCLEACPSSMFQLNSRCLTRQECENLPSLKSNPDVFYKAWKTIVFLVEGKARSGQCSLACPHGYMSQGKHGCLKCDKACPKSKC